MTDNFVLKSYHSVDIKELEATAFSILDLKNIGDTSNIESQVQGLKSLFFQRNSDSNSI